MNNLDLTPEPEEIVQAEEAPLDIQPIAVGVVSPVETRELPAVRAGYFTAQGVGTQTAVRLLSFEPRRKSATFLSSVTGMWISNTQAGAQMGGSSAFYVPPLMQITITHLDQVWVCADEDTTDVSVMTTFWSV